MDEDELLEQQEEKLMEELRPLKEQLDEIMSRYPHASYNDVCDWLSQ